MIFGEGLTPATSAEPATWMQQQGLTPTTGRVGGLLPLHFESYVLVEAAPSQPEWWMAQQQIMRAVAEVLADFTATPDVSWFGVWEGHGFQGGGSVTGFGFAGDNLPPEERASAQAELRVMQAEHERTRATVQAGLAEVPRFPLRDRTYYLFSGPVASVVNIRWPGKEEWFRPDLSWPDDRSWFVGTDVDFWCNYIGGPQAMTNAVTSRLPDLCQPTSLDEALRIED